MSRSFTFVLVLVVCLLCIGPLTAQDSGLPVLTPVDGNPVFGPSMESAWDAGGAVPLAILPYEGQFAMFYVGGNADQSQFSVGYATSNDGLTWTRYDGNPVFTPDSSVAPNGVFNFTVFRDGEQWIMPFTPYDQAGNMSRQDMIVATSPSPVGPWTLAEETALASGGLLDWDVGSHWMPKITQVDDEFVMYFSSNGGKIGMATSPDGHHWTKYDDPTTTDSRFETSDPVLTPATLSSSWDRVYTANPLALQTSTGWEMFYTGGGENLRDALGYATSPDGLHWTRQGDAPILVDPDMFTMFPVAVVESGESTYLYYVSGVDGNVQHWMTNAAVIEAP